MPHDPFTTVSWRKQLNFRLRQAVSLCRRPITPDRIHPARSGPPNLLVLAVDTLRYDHLGLAGYSRARTPAIDALAAAGVCFDDVLAPSPWTLPSFTSSLTGVMPAVHGATLTGKIRNMDTQAPRCLSQNAVTLAAHLRKQGYRTAAFYANPFFGFGLAESFDLHAYHNLPAADLAWLALDWIRRHAERPFFCFVLWNDPHEPTTPPARDLRPFLTALRREGIQPTSRQLRALVRWGTGGDRETDLGRATFPLSKGSAAALATKIALYDAAIAHVDRVVGQVRERFRQWGLQENTLLTLYADHGEEFLDHLSQARHWNHDPRAVRAIGHGHTLFQELLHVPWLICGPQIPSGVRLNVPVSLCDVAPSLADWLGVDPLPRPAGLDPSLLGRSQASGVAPAATGRGESSAPDRLLVAEEMAYGPDLVAVRRGSWKLVAERTGGPLGLYELASDPGEQRDRRQESPDVLAKLQGDLAIWRRAAGKTPFPGEGEPGWENVAETVRRRLKELGYTE